MQVFGGVERKRFLRKHVIRQKMRNFAPLFGVVRALVRYIECRVEQYGSDGNGTRNW